MDKYREEDLSTLSEAKWQLLSTSFFPNKDLKKVNLLAIFFLFHNPDIIMLTEVGGRESLENLNHFFLEDKYDVVIAPSNSDRGIDLGYLVKKTLPFVHKLIPHTKVILSNGKKFARGLFELQLIKNERPVFINFLCHLKSKLDLKKQDFEGRGQRKAEVEFLKKIFLKRRDKNPDIPICITGDLNSIIYKEATEPEILVLLKQTNLKDIFEILDRPIERRITYCYFNSRQERYDMQLDYVLIPDNFKNRIIADGCYVASFFPNEPIEYPSTLPEKVSLPSDHFPVIWKISV